MAATPKGPQRRKLEYTVDGAIYDLFVKICSQRGYAPQIVIERLMKRYSETGQI
jgi:hypothetical protein